MKIPGISDEKLYPIEMCIRDRSKFHYEGLIRIDKKAQKSNAYQKNQNLVMSKEVFVDSRPYLEILANDVRCTHGSTTGQLDKEQLYFAKTRGLSNEVAQKMLLEGFIGDIFNKMEEAGLERSVILSVAKDLGVEN